MLFFYHYDSTSIDVNIDGLRLFDSSKTKFWPILGKVVNTLDEPFTIGVYCGPKKTRKM